MDYTVNWRQLTHINRQVWSETCFTLNNGIRCNWAFFDMLHRFGFIGR